MKLIDESRRSVIAVKKYTTPEDIVNTNIYYSYVKQLCDTFPISEDKVGFDIVFLFVAYRSICQVV